eukprot:GHVR01157517.1.p1 GENE.GHVR01157517.1~~GHVR01157517.1.p1  ORF type:complete len:165 (+),score=21.06 GHVR01157517.1:27-521(+)
MMMMQISIYISVLIVGYTSAEPNIYEQISDQLSRPILFYNDIEEQRPSTSKVHPIFASNTSRLRYGNTQVPPLSYRRNAFTMILKNERSKELMFKCVLNEDTSDIYMTLPRALYKKDFYTHAGYTYIIIKYIYIIIKFIYIIIYIHIFIEIMCIIMYIHTHIYI